MTDSFMRDVALASEIDEAKAMLVVEEFLLRLHKLEFERDKYQNDFVGEVWWQMSERGFYHLFGFIESFASEGDQWEPGTVS